MGQIAMHKSAVATPVEPSPPHTVAVSVGTMSSGFKLYGPFPDADAAWNYAASRGFDTWETVPLIAPTN